MIQKPIFAPGARVIVRDAEWLVRKVDKTSSDGQAISVIGLSELVKDKEAIFLSEIEERIEVIDPIGTHYAVVHNYTQLNVSFFPWSIGYAVDDTATSVRKLKGDIPTAFALEQNYPNPLNLSTTIRYVLPTEALVTLNVFNLLGQVIATLVNEQQQAGSYQVQFDGKGFSSGVYFYRMKTEDPLRGSPKKSGQAGQSFVQTKKFVLVK